MHLMICHRCVLVFTEFLDLLKQIIILIWVFLLFIAFSCHWGLECTSGIILLDYCGSGLITGSDRIGPEIGHLALFLTFFLYLLCL